MNLQFALQIGKPSPPASFKSPRLRRRSVGRETGHLGARVAALKENRGELKKLFPQLHFLGPLTDALSAVSTIEVRTQLTRLLGAELFPAVVLTLPVE